MQLQVQLSVSLFLLRKLFLKRLLRIFLHIQCFLAILILNLNVIMMTTLDIYKCFKVSNSLKLYLKSTIETFKQTLIIASKRIITKISKGIVNNVMRSSHGQVLNVVMISLKIIAKVIVALCLMMTNTLSILQISTLSLHKITMKCICLDLGSNSTTWSVTLHAQLSVLLILLRQGLQ